MAWPDFSHGYLALVSFLPSLMVLLVFATSFCFALVYDSQNRETPFVVLSTTVQLLEMLRPRPMHFWLCLSRHMRISAPHYRLAFERVQAGTLCLGSLVKYNDLHARWLTALLPAGSEDHLHLVPVTN